MLVAGRGRSLSLLVPASEQSDTRERSQWQTQWPKAADLHDSLPSPKFCATAATEPIQAQALQVGHGPNQSSHTQHLARSRPENRLW
eukprot:3939081-Rhodomonas_salina.1